MSSFTISRFKSDDKEDWLRHWHGYMARHLPDAVRPEVCERNWAAVLAADGRLEAWALRDSRGCVQGFAHYVQHFCTESGTNEAYLMDLYVDPVCRGQSGGRALMSHVFEQCRQEGIYQLVWITVPGVEYNQRFYGNYTSARQWDRYVVLTNSSI